GLDQRLSDQGGFEQRQLFATHHHVLRFAQYKERCSATGPSASAGIKVSAPTSNTVPISRPTNSAPCVGSVPGLAGWRFLPTSDPAIAMTGIITPKRPTNMQKASRQFQKGVLAFRPAKALPLLLAAEETAYSTSLKPCGPGLSIPLRPV